MFCNTCGKDIGSRKFFRDGAVVCIHCAAQADKAARTQKPAEAAPIVVPAVLIRDEHCAKCYRKILSTETPMVLGEEILCESCWAAAKIEAQQHAQGRAPAVLAQIGSITVTTECIHDGSSRFPIEQVLSVRPARGFLPGAMIVDVFDLVRHSRRYKFVNADSARRFVAAIQRAKGSITVEHEDKGGWFILWG